MTDRRFWRANDRVADTSLSGAVSGVALSDGDVMRVCVPHADLCRSVNGARDKQMLHGQPFTVLDVHDGWAFGYDTVDDYVGYLPATALDNLPSPTHRICRRVAHVYSDPDIKSPESAALSFFAEVTAGSRQAGFHALTEGGYVAAQHLKPLSWRAQDAAAVAEMFLGTPYLWGGNTDQGIDCSGLMQLALYAHGRACPRDSDLQAKTWRAVPDRGALQRGDLVFWDGHVGMMLDEDRLIHANAHHMAVAIEPLDAAIERIGQREFGAVTGFARP